MILKRRNAGIESSPFLGASHVPEKASSRLRSGSPPKSRCLIGSLLQLLLHEDL
jgi:hypothetical protein